MFLDPKKVVFEDVKDIVDYIDKGFPPSKSDFEEILKKMKNPDNVTDPSILNKQGKETIITDEITNDPDLIEKVLTRIYENKRRRFRNGILTILGAGVLAATAYVLIPKILPKKKEVEYDPFYDDYEEYEDYDDED
jgi:hypothetical protein